MIVGWYAYPGGFGTGDANVYATRVDNRLDTGETGAHIVAAKDVPNDQGGKVRVEWYASSRDQLNQQAITSTRSGAVLIRLCTRTRWPGGARSENHGSGIAFFQQGRSPRKLQALDYFWELIGTQTAAIALRIRSALQLASIRRPQILPRIASRFSRTRTRSHQLAVEHSLGAARSTISPRRRRCS